MDPKYGAFYFNNKVTVHTLGIQNFTWSIEQKSSSPFQISGSFSGSYGKKKLWMCESTHKGLTLIKTDSALHWYASSYQ